LKEKDVALRNASNMKRAIRCLNRTLSSPGDNQIPRIICYPSFELREKSKRVIDVHDPIIQRGIDDLTAVATAEKALGCSGPQIGLHYEVFVLRRPFAFTFSQVSANLKSSKAHRQGTKRRLELYKQASPSYMEFINPVVLKKSKSTKVYLEGCLSLPDQSSLIERPVEIRVGYVDREGEEHLMDLSGLPAVAFQHELDHLSGRLMTDIELKKSSMMSPEEVELQMEEGYDVTLRDMMLFYGEDG
jgi:peptide deformylase